MVISEQQNELVIKHTIDDKKSISIHDSGLVQFSDGKDFVVKTIHELIRDLHLNIPPIWPEFTVNDCRDLLDILDNYKWLKK